MKLCEAKLKRKRWRLRFSARSLFIFVTLVGAYFGAWEATKRYGVPIVVATIREEDTALEVEVFDAWSTFPLIIGCDAQFNEMNDVDGRRFAVNEWVQCNYYLWLFGPLVKLPIDAESAHSIPPSWGIGGGASSSPSQ